MTESLDLTLLSRKEFALYKLLLLFYPEAYRQRFGEEMLLVFQDMYAEELRTKGHVGVGFWISVVEDGIKSVLAEHIETLRKDGMKKYLQHTLHFNRYNLIGVGLLLPFTLLLGSDFLGRLIQGNFTRPNTAFYNYLSQTILYSEFRGQVFLLWTLLVYAPLLAAVLNLIPFINFLKPSKRKLNTAQLLVVNPIGVGIVGLGLLFVAIAFGHDTIPCLVNHLFTQGLTTIWQTVQICAKA